MADFHQEGTVTTLHDLYLTFDAQMYLRSLERKLEQYSRDVKISLLLPCLYAELEKREVIDRIVEKLDKVSYLKNIVVALNGTQKEEDFYEAKKYFRRLQSSKRDIKLVWIKGAGIQEIFRKIEEKDISIGVHGKGQSVWITLGYLFARDDSDVIALHDCDIVTYDRMLLGRLIEPTANPHNDFEFCKGYYCRISPTERAMKGRVSRLFFTPFVDAMMNIMYSQKNQVFEFSDVLFYKTISMSFRTDVRNLLLLTAFKISPSGRNDKWIFINFSKTSFVWV